VLVGGGGGRLPACLPERRLPAGACYLCMPQLSCSHVPALPHYHHLPAFPPTYIPSLCLLGSQGGWSAAARA